MCNAAGTQVKSFNYCLTFGKHKGVTLSEVLEEDSEYIIWLHDCTDLNIADTVVEHANEYVDKDYGWEDYHDSF